MWCTCRRRTHLESLHHKSKSTFTSFYFSTVVLSSTDLVELAVQPRHLVMQQVPSEALKVKEQQAGQHLDQQVAEQRRVLGQMDRGQEPAHQRQWEDENQVVVERQAEAATH